MRLKILRIKFTIATCSLIPTLHASFDAWTYEASTSWESKYVENGRNELESGGIFTAAASAAYKGFSFGAQSFLGDSVDYKEIQLTTAYSFELDKIALMGGWTHLEFDPGSFDDDELFLEIGSELFAGFKMGAHAVYSVEAEGSFLELTLAYPLVLFDGMLEIEPYLQENFDFGYRTAAHDGLSNFQTGIDATYSLTESFTFKAFLAHSWAQTDVTREGLGDVSWGGVGLEAKF